MLAAVATCFDCSRPALWECAVTKPTVRCAGLELADHLVGASCNPAFAFTAAMFATETPGVRGGGAIRHGALWLLLPTTVCVAMLEPWHCVSNATIKLTLSICTMLAAETSCLNESGAAFRLAHFVLAAVIAMPVAVSFYIDGGCIAVDESAEPIGAMFRSETTSENSCIAPIS